MKEFSLCHFATYAHIFKIMNSFSSNILSLIHERVTPFEFVGKTLILKSKNDVFYLIKAYTMKSES